MANFYCLNTSWCLIIAKLLFFTVLILVSAKSKKKYLWNKKILDEVDIVSVAGAVKNLVLPKEPADAEFMLRQIETSKSLYDIKQVILLSHTDCGAYGGRRAFSSEAEEVKYHLQNLHKAKEIILAK